MSRTLGGDAGFHIGLLPDQFKPLLGAEDEGGGGENSSEHARWSDDAYRLAAVLNRVAGARIDDMAVSLAINCEGSEIVP